MVRGTGWEAANPCDPPPLPIPVLRSESWLSEARGADQAVGLRGKACLSLWNFIIFNYLDHNGSLSPLLPVPLFHLVTQTQASLTQPCLFVFLSIWPSASFPSLCCLTLAYHANYHLFLILCHFSSSALFSPLAYFFFMQGRTVH